MAQARQHGTEEVMTNTQVAPMDGEQLLASNDTEAFREVAEELVLIASDARHDFRTFFEFVMEEEKTKAAVTMAPHQQVAADFVLEHRRAVLMMPREHSKTFLLVALLLWHIGKDANFRGAIVSATQEQAMKVLRAVADYIQFNPRLKLVFPHLRPSRRKNEPWTQIAITIDRPPGTRDPTLVALGMGGAVLGARLKFVAVDDILTQENTATEEQRRKVIEWVDGSVLGTIDKKGETKALLVGTAWHPQDLLHQATKRGWATLKMSILGDIFVQDDEDESNRVEGGEQWDHGELALAKPPYLRLKAHGPDPAGKVLLWPEVFGGAKELEKLRRSKLPSVFQQMYMMVARDVEAALFRSEWIEECKKKAREMDFQKLVLGYAGQNPVFTGVDLGIEIGEHNDDTAFFTFEVLPSGHRRVLDVEFGKYDGAKKVQKVVEKVQRYGSWCVIVESNGGQKLLAEWALDRDVSLPVKPVQTGANKSHPERGLPGLALEIFNGAWLLPNDDWGQCDDKLQRALDEAINYVPDKHTGDVLMAWWLAFEGARQWGIGTGAQAVGGSTGLGDYLMR
jgi:hypothetical protein